MGSSRDGRAKYPSHRCHNRPMSEPPPPNPPSRPRTPPKIAPADDPSTPLKIDLSPSKVDQMLCERCGVEMYRMHAVWRCPSCGFKTDCCGW